MTSGKLSSIHQPIWESSGRPLHPKCVWIESFGESKPTNGGRRHFILDYHLSNSLRSRNDTSSSSPSFELPTIDKTDEIQYKMNSLSIVGSSDKIHSDRAFSSLRTRLEVASVQSEMAESTETPCDSSSVVELEQEIPPSMERITNEIDSSKNLLAERVLQWLDLAGGRVHNRSEQMGKLLNASKRRSVTAKETRKSSELHDDNTKLRREPVRQTSMTLNDESVQPNQSIVSLSFIDLFPATYKCSRKFLSLRHSKPDRLEPLDLHSAVPVRPARNNKYKHGGKLKPKRLEYFDDHYQSMIQRQILETTCNTQAAKRQLHIFMPNLPKRNLLSDADKVHLVSPKSTADTDSCLSCRLAAT